jgi:hypothetical protein
MRSRHPDFVSSAGPSVPSDSSSSESDQHGTPELMCTPSQSPSNAGHNYGDNDINMNFGFDVRQSPFHYDTDDAGLGRNGSATP